MIGGDFYRELLLIFPHFQAFYVIFRGSIVAHWTAGREVLSSNLLRELGYLLFLSYSSESKRFPIGDATLLIFPNNECLAEQPWAKQAKCKLKMGLNLKLKRIPIPQVFFAEQWKNVVQSSQQ